MIETIEEAVKAKRDLTSVESSLIGCPKIFVGAPKKAKYNDTVITFDIETSSFYEGNEKRACMYIWQMCINGYVIFGRTWDEFTEVIYRLKDYFNTDVNHRIIVWVHNLSYEFQWFRKLFIWREVFATDTRKVLYCVTTSGIEFRCSYLLSGYSLAALGNNLTSHTIKKQVGDLDYNLVRGPETPLNDTELGYCAGDVLVVAAYIEEQLDEFGNFCHFVYTNTGRVRKLLRDDTAGDLDYHLLISTLTITPDEYKLLKKGFQGGYTHAGHLNAGKTLKEVDSIDFTSSYPAVMVTEKYPMSKGKKVVIKSVKELCDLSKSYCILVTVKITGLTEKFKYEHFLSESKCQGKGIKAENGRIISADEIITVLTDVDLITVLNCYNITGIGFGDCYIYKKEFLPKSLIKVILKLYKGKTTLKGTKKIIEYMRSKGMLNSCYGMTVTDIVRMIIEYLNKEGWQTSDADVDKDIAKYNKSKSRTLFYPWGVWVTAYARRNLWSGIFEMKSDYIYSDTDSIKFTNLERHKDYINKYNQGIIKKTAEVCKYYELPFEDFAPKTIKGVTKMIGFWDLETEKSKYTRFKTLGSKRYIYEQDDELHITIAGVKKSSGAEFLSSFKDPFKAFNNNLIFDKDHSGKLTLTYIDDIIEGNKEDYKGNKFHYREESSIHMEPSEYNMKLSKDYENYIFERGEEYVI